MNKRFLCLGFLVCCFLVAGCRAANSVEIEVYVYDEMGDPIGDAIVDFSFSRSSSSKNFRKRTNQSGWASARSEAIFTVPVTIHKEGYYTSKYEFGSKNNSGVQTKQLVLIKIGDRVPLFAKKFLGSYPVKDKPVYFDFKAGDWVEPYGVGTELHVGFIFHSISKSIFDFEGAMTILFKNDGDGLVQQEEYVDEYSDFKMVRHAPKDGYQPTLEISKSQSGIDSKLLTSSSSGSQGYYGMFIRTNTVKDQVNQIVYANYAKIYGEIEFSPYHEELAFTYFYNPSVNSFNLELDFEKNMSVYNSSRERIRYP